MSNTAYSLDDYVADLRRIAHNTALEEEILEEVGPLARRFASDKGWLEDKHYQVDPEQGFGVHLLHEDSDHSLAVFAVSWLPGRGTPPHDHGTWAVVVGVDGVEHDIRYDRLDDGSRANYAELSVKQSFDAAEGELICMRTGGIHSVQNNTDKITLSLHTYGKHVNHTNRSQFDPVTNGKKDFVLKVETGAK